MRAQKPIVLILFLVTALLVASIAYHRRKRYHRRIQFIDGIDAMYHVPDSYFDDFNALDIAARKCGRTRAECKQQYMSAVIPFSGAEKRRISGWIRKADRFIMNFDRAIALSKLFHGVEWKLCKLRDDVEGGYPHTHGEVIFLPASLLLESDESHIVRTLIHELIHVAQRKNTQIIRMLYTWFWGLTPQELQRSHPLRRASRSNPDLDKYVYLVTSKPADPPTTCVQLYNNSAGINLGSTRSALVTLSDNFQEIASCDYEHPNEAMAYILSELIVVTGPSRQPKHVGNVVFAVDALREWLKWLEVR